MSKGFLYVDVNMGGNSVIVLKKKYKREEIRAKLLVPGGYSEAYVDELLKRAIYIEEPLTLKCPIEHGIITTQVHNWEWDIYWGEKIIITPDACFARYERNKKDQCVLYLRTLLHNVWWALNKYVFKNPWYI